ILVLLESAQERDLGVNRELLAEAEVDADAEPTVETRRRQDTGACRWKTLNPTFNHCTPGSIATSSRSARVAIAMRSRARSAQRRRDDTGARPCLTSTSKSCSTQTAFRGAGRRTTRRRLQPEPFSLTDARSGRTAAHFWASLLAGAQPRRGAPSGE